MHLNILCPSERPQEQPRVFCRSVHVSESSGTLSPVWKSQRVYVLLKTPHSALLSKPFLDHLGLQWRARPLPAARRVGRQAALAVALSGRCGCAARAKKRGRQPVAEARPPPTSAQALLSECPKPPARSGVSSEWCGVRRRATESACWVCRATVPWRSDACVTTVRPDVRSLCDRCILWTLSWIVTLLSHLGQSLYRNFTAFRSQRAWSANLKTRTDF